jgi:hypothetical protein
MKPVSWLINLLEHDSRWENILAGWHLRVASISMALVLELDIKSLTAGVSSRCKIILFFLIS